MVDLPRARAVLAACLLLLVGAVAGPASARTSSCPARVLVLSAMPLELNPLVERAQLSTRDSSKGRTFYSGQLAGGQVVLGMSGIGPANATATTEAGLALPGCSFRAVLFSGVAGSKDDIGDVAVPARWTLDEGRRWHPVDPAMLRVARGLKTRGLGLTQDVPVGDAACACPGVDAATPAHLPTQVRLLVGGDGATTDPFAGRAVPCVPGGGDIAGCEPCLTVPGTVNSTGAFAARVPEAADLIAGTTGGQASSTLPADAIDEETAAVLAVTRRHHLPFLGFRGVSDGKGDPLGLPGFPVQFVVYRQLAADNAAAAVIGFLKAWGAAGQPTGQSR